MNRILRIVALVAMLACTSALSARSDAPRITAKVEPDTIYIGECFELTLEVERDLVQAIEMPTIDMSKKDQEGEPMLELLSEGKVDTVPLDGRRRRLTKQFRLQAFAEGIYDFGRPHALYADKNILDTIFAKQSLRLVVLMPAELDTMAMPTDSASMHAALKPHNKRLYPQKDLPFLFDEISGYIGYSLLGLIVLTILILGLIYWLRRRGKRIKDIFRSAPPLPPHIVAITALEELNNRKLWQNNKHKLYYSGLSDILRTYLDGRYGVGAMEMTTDEIAAAVRGCDIPQGSMMNLLDVLREADLVKFAKAQPEAADNEACYNKAYYFVEETKPADKADEEEEDNPTNA